MNKKLDLNKKRDYSSLAFWSWNGDMEEHEVVRQVNDFAASGYGGFFIHSRAGLEIPYMQEKWFEACRIAIEEAEKSNLTVWIYDEDGWPSGFAGGIIPAKGESYQFKRMEFCFMKENDKIPDNAIAGYCKVMNTSSETYVQTSLDKAELIAYYETDPNYVDLLNPDVTKAFLESTHEVYKAHFGKYFGKTIMGCFSDEPQLNNAGFTWSFSLQEFYKNITGGNLLDGLWLLLDKTDRGDTFRHDYWKTIGKLYKESFTDNISNWCEKNNLLFTGHFACEDGLCDQISSNGGVMQMYPSMQLPGIDHLGKRIASPVLMKQISSVAEQYGKDRILSESFGCTGWNLSFADMMWMWGYQASLGINLLCLHLSSYTIKGVRKRDYPAFFSYQEPWWEEFKNINDALSGLSTLLSQGESDHKVLIISPLSGMWMKTDRPGYSQEEKLISYQYRMLIENLLYLQIGFDIGDESLIQKDGEIEGNKFKLGNKSYEMVFVCQTPTVLDRVENLYEKFLENNGVMIFMNQMPGLINARPTEKFQNDIFKKSYLIQNRKDLIRKFLDCKQFKRSITFCPRFEDSVSSDLIVRVREYEGFKIIYIWNKCADSDRKLTGKITGYNEIKQLDLRNENLLDGTIQLSRYDGACTCFDLVLPAKGSFVYCITPRNETLEIPCTSSYVECEKTSLMDWKITRKDHNALTVDNASYSIDGGPFSETMPVIHLQDELYDRIAGVQKSTSVVIRYEFEISENFDLGFTDLRVVAEAEQCLDITINGISLFQKESGWWTDHSMLEYSISSLVSSGRNRIEMFYQMPVWQQNIDLEKAFETQRNRFHYPVGFEAIYLHGEFSVKASGTINEKSNFWSIDNAVFIIDNDNQTYKLNELTSQGLWFYRGDIELSIKKEFTKTDAGEKYFLEWDDQLFVMSTVHVNGVKAGAMLYPPYHCDITSFLIDGVNEIVLTMCGSNRNLFGPHHHIKGEPTFVGPNTFFGKRGYEDFVNSDITGDNTWTSTYNFVKTQITGQIWLVKEILI